MRRLSGALLVLASSALVPAFVTPMHAQAKRPLRSRDLYRLKDVRAPELSPDRNWVA